MGSVAKLVMPSGRVEDALGQWCLSPRTERLVAFAIDYRGKERVLMSKLLMLTALGVAFGFAQETAAPPPAPNDYSDAQAWLCKPGRHDACDVDLTTTVISADGKLSRETWKANPNAPVDCFYVYPTVSTDQTPNSDMTPDDAELNVVRQQFARFGSKCKLYAPL